MDLVQIYECLCDRTRLRILNLLTQSPLCVCHIQEVLDQPQVKISKHLAYLRQRGLVEAKQEQNFVIYSLPRVCPPELERNLRCLQDCVSSEPLLKADLGKLAKLGADCEEALAAASQGSASRKKRK